MILIDGEPKSSMAAAMNALSYFKGLDVGPGVAGFVDATVYLADDTKVDVSYVLTHPEIAPHTSDSHRRPNLSDVVRRGLFGNFEAEGMTDYTISSVHLPHRGRQGREYRTRLRELERKTSFDRLASLMLYHLEASNYTSDLALYNL
jgi:hypothetical protein